ncbi:MAG: glycerophosphodiester phosphodiesterase family protein [Pseudohongiellaceae bacterium]
MYKALTVPMVMACLASPTPLQSQTFDLQAHRGGMGLYSEGTLTAFANALEMGVTTLELDTQLTADGEVVVTHDRQVQARNCQDTGPAFAGDPQYPYVGKYIKDLTLAQVQTLDCGSRQLAGYPQQRTVPGARMPLLKEVFDLVRQYRADEVMLNIETKVEAGAPEETAPREDFVRGVLAVIEASDMADQVTIQSFDWGALMLVNELAPAIPLLALTNGQSFLRCNEAGRSPWLGGLDMDDFDCDVVAAVHSFGASALSPVHGQPQDGSIADTDYVPFVTEQMIRAAHDAGMEVIPWTVDDRATMNYLLDLGVDGLITNYPDRLRDVLSERGRELPRSYLRF